MIIQNLSTLIINKLSAEQYAAALAAGLINANELYLTPEEEIDLTNYLTKTAADKLYATIEALNNLSTSLNNTNNEVNRLRTAYLENINYQTYFAFDTSEIVVGSTASASEAE